MLRLPHQSLLRFAEVEAGPDGAHDDLFNIFSRLQIIFYIKPLFHLGPGPPLPKSWQWQLEPERATKP